MPAYNSEKYIAQAIESVINQTHTNWELLIIDDFSTDGTKEIIEKFSLNDDRIQPIFRKENSGKPSIAKNSAFEFVRGDYIAFLDSDDLWLPDKLEKQLQLMQHYEYALCYTGGYYINENSVNIGHFLPKYTNGNIFRNMLLRYEINNQSVLIKRSFFAKFNEDVTIGEDYNLFMNIVLNHKVCNIKEKLIKYRVHTLSITKNKTKDLSQGTLVTLAELDKKFNILKKYPLPYFISWLRASRFKLYLYISKNYR